MLLKPPSLWSQMWLSYNSGSTLEINSVFVDEETEAQGGLSGHMASQVFLTQGLGVFFLLNSATF